MQMLSGAAVFTRYFALVCGLVLLPAYAWAQSATTGTIAGTARDSTGAALPGVTVEAASPALIEKVRSVVTDGSGEYKIVELRPGTYAVSFSLPGFGTVRREGLELRTGFTATVDAELQVGNVAETITVTGASPVVDTQNVRTQNVLSREVLDTLPTGKTIQAFSSLTLGARVVGGGQDLGGSQGEAPVSIAVHGGRNLDQRMYMDGMTYNSPGATGGGYARFFMPNQMAVQEVTLETSGQNAEMETSGVQLNLVPKEGSNAFRATVVTQYTNGDFQRNNLDDELEARGLTSAPTVKKIYDYGFAGGGPIVRDRLWFYSANRWWGNQLTAPGNYYNATPDTLFYTADLSRPAYTDTYNRDNTVRLTWQAAQKHKITFLEAFQRNCFCFNGVDANVSPEAAGSSLYYPVTLTQAGWTYPITNRLLLQSGFTYGFNGAYSAGGGHDFSGLTRIPITDLSNGYVYGAAGSYTDFDGPGGHNRQNQWNGNLTVSYVTGSHAFKTGLMVRRAFYQISTRRNDPSISYALQRLTPGGPLVPASVTYWSTYNHSRTEFDQYALYAQDQWTLNRLTLNMGLRLDTMHGWVPDQSQPAGDFVPALTVSKIDNVPNWKDANVRLGGAYDLFGNGKTALKASVGRYVQSEATGLIQAVNPLAAVVTSASRVWTDNGDYVPQESELAPLSNAAFGTSVIRTRYSDEVMQGWGVRPYNWTVTASVQQELRSGLGVTANYYRRWYGNFQATDNLAVTPADFDPFCLTAPVDARLPGGGGNQICGYYDVKPASFGLVNNLVVRASNFGNQKEVYDGLDVSATGRLGPGAQLSGGLSTGRTVTDNCFVVDSPQQAQPGFCRVTYSFANQTQLKLSGFYPLPWGFQISGVLQNLAGIPRAGVSASLGAVYGAPVQGASYAAPNSVIAPSLGRNLAACGARNPCTATTTIAAVPTFGGTTSTNLVPAYGGGNERRLTQLDLRLTKVVPIRQLRVRAMVDAYNVFNANNVLLLITQYGANYLRPTQILGGRLFKFGAQIDF